MDDTGRGVNSPTGATAAASGLLKLKVMGKVKITQVKSTIDRPKRQKDTIKALGIRRVNHSVIHEATPQILGMIEKVNHLVEVEQL
jgi:large subunit ribosomal protein L30